MNGWRTRPAPTPTRYAAAIPRYAALPVEHEASGQVIGFALYFHPYATFLTRYSDSGAALRLAIRDLGELALLRDALTRPRRTLWELADRDASVPISRNVVSVAGVRDTAIGSFVKTTLRIQEDNREEGEADEQQEPA